MRTLVAVAFWGTIWAVLSLLVDLNAKLLPDFFKTLLALKVLLLDKSFFGHLALTFYRIIPGITLAAAIGVPAGLLFVRYNWIGAVFEPALSFFRGIPVAALFPVAIILFGIGDGARLMLVVYVALPIIAAATYVGASERDETKLRRRYLALARAKVAWYHYYLCILWDALPAIISGLKISLSISLVVVIVSEMFFIGGSGVGWFTWDQYQAFNFANMYASIFVIGMLSLALNTIFDWAGTKLKR